MLTSCTAAPAEGPTKERVGSEICHLRAAAAGARRLRLGEGANIHDAEAYSRLSEDELR